MRQRQPSGGRRFDHLRLNLQTTRRMDRDVALEMDSRRGSSGLRSVFEHVMNALRWSLARLESPHPGRVIPNRTTHSDSQSSVSSSFLTSHHPLPPLRVTPSIQRLRSSHQTHQREQGRPRRRFGPTSSPLRHEPHLAPPTPPVSLRRYEWHNYSRQLDTLLGRPNDEPLEVR